jgi:hypothetical protein
MTCERDRLKFWDLRRHSVALSVLPFLAQERTATDTDRNVSVKEPGKRLNDIGYSSAWGWSDIEQDQSSDANLGEGSNDNDNDNDKFHVCTISAIETNDTIAQDQLQPLHKSNSKTYFDTFTKSSRRSFGFHKAEVNFQRKKMQQSKIVGK